MTILGFHVIDTRSAIVWADTEIYADGEPAGGTCKIAGNALAGVVGVGTGSVLMLHEAAAVVQRCAGLDDMLTAMPAALRACVPSANASHAARSAAAWARYVLVGYSAKIGRVAGWLCLAENDFEPSPSPAWCCPAIATADALVTDEHGALLAAQIQMAEIRRAIPAATGRTLMVAEIDGDTITTRPAWDIETGRRIRRARQNAGVYPSPGLGGLLSVEAGSPPPPLKKG